MKSKKRKRIEIKIHTKAKEIDEATKEKERKDEEKDIFSFKTPISVPAPFDNHVDQGYDVENGVVVDNDESISMNEVFEFYQETHEEELPEIQRLERKRQRMELEGSLLDLARQDRVARQEISQWVRSQIQEKQATVHRNLERLRNKAHADERSDLEKLLQLYKEKVASNQSKIRNSMSLLTKRHQQEVQKQIQQHRQMNASASSQQQQDIIWKTESQRLQQKHRHQLQEFHAKGQSVHQKCESDYMCERDRRRQHHNKRKHDLEEGMQKWLHKIQINYEQVHQRHIKRHVVKWQQQRQDILDQIQQLERLNQNNNNNNTDESMLDESGKSTASDKKLPACDASTSSARSVLSTEKDERIELRPPSPIKSRSIDDHQDRESTTSKKEEHSSVARQRHRKAILSTIPKQLSIEVHNEGIWISLIGPNSSESSSSNKDRGRGGDSKKSSLEQSNRDEFIPWGLKARTALHAIMCGEIPPECSALFRFNPNNNLVANPRANNSSNSNNSDSTQQQQEKQYNQLQQALQQQGGHIRCVVTDLRTCEVTAQSQRIQSVKEQEEHAIQALEKRAAGCSQAMTDSEKALSRAETDERNALDIAEKAKKELDKAKKLVHDFKVKFARYFGADGRLIKNSVSEKDERKLMDASHRYSANHADAEKREKTAQQALADAKTNVQKCQLHVKQAQKAATVAGTVLRKRRALTQECRKVGRPSKQSETMDFERASVRVADVIAAFRLAAEKRRGALAAKRNSTNNAAWFQGLGDISMVLKKSLWHKMQRKRRQQLVLRPNQDDILSELKQEIRDKFKAATATTTGNSKNNNNNNNDIEKQEAAVQRAEQLFLLATHPFVREEKDRLPDIPTTALNDSWAEPGWYVDLSVNEQPTSSSTLLPKAPDCPLLDRNICQVGSAPGRQTASFLGPQHLKSLTLPLSAVSQATSLAETPAKSIQVDTPELDPLQISDTSMEIGYTFTLKSLLKSSQSRRKSASKDDIDASAKSAAAADGGASQTKSSNRSNNSNNSTVPPSPTLMRRTSTKGEKSRRRSSKVEQSPSSSKKVDVVPMKRVIGQPQGYNPQQQKQQPPQAAPPAATTPGLTLRGVYPRGQLDASSSSAASAQYKPQYIKQVTAPGGQLPQLTQAPPRPTLAPQPQLLPQPPSRQFSSPQQQHYQQQQQQQRQMLRMMPPQQRQATTYQTATPMPFFTTPMARQPSFAQQQAPLAMHVPAPPLAMPPRQAQQQPNGDDQNDPLFMLNDL